MKTPELHSNFFLACVQLFHWVFFKPLTLRRYTGGLAPDLGEDFSLWEARKHKSKRLNRFILVFLATILFSPWIVSFPLVVGIDCIAHALNGMPIADIFSTLTIVIKVVGVASGVALGVAYGVALGLAYGVAGGVAGGVVFGVAFGVAGGVVFGVAFGVAGGVAYGVALGVALGVAFGVAGGVAVGVAGGVAVGVAGGVAGGVVFGVVFGVAGGVALGVNFVCGFFRIIFYFFEIPFHLMLFFFMRLRPNKSASIVKHSPVFWDEIIWFPLPFLDEMLRMASRQDRNEGLKLIAHVAVSFRKEKYANSALSWITAETMKGADDMGQIVQSVADSQKWLPDDLGSLGKDTAETVPVLRAIAHSLESSQNAGDYAKRLALRNAVERLSLLNDRVGFLGRLASERWKPVIEKWHGIVSEALMNGEVSSRGATKTVNPYQTGNPLQLLRKSLFKGRSEQRNTIVNALLEKSRPTIALHGPRRMGKTSFLLQLPALLPGDTIPVFMDLQRQSATESISSFLFNIAASICRDARPYKIIIPRPARQTFADSPYAAFEDWLEDSSNAALWNFNLLLAFDEFEKLGEAIQKGRMEMGILDEFRHWIQHQSQMAFLFAGVRTLDELGPNWSSYFINIKPVSMGCLSEEETRELIENPDPESEFSLRYEPEVVDRIVETTLGHPYLVQLVCSAVVEESNKAEVGIADSAILDLGLKRALVQGEAYFRNVWDEMAGEDGRAVLRGIARGEASGKLENADEKTRAALARMARLKVICRVEEGNYTVKIPLFRRWILEYAPD